jgi:hypothetical protein
VNGYLPASEDDAIHHSTESIESDPHTASTVQAVFIDMDGVMPRVLFQFGVIESVEIASIVHRIYQQVNASLACQKVIMSFDTRVPTAITMPRREVGIDRSTTKDSGFVDTSTDYDNMTHIMFREADKRDKLNVRSYLGRRLCQMIRHKKPSAQFAILLPDNTIIGTEHLCDVLEPVLSHDESDTRIPAAVIAMQQASLLVPDDQIILHVNDTDIFWLPCTVGPLAAIHLHRPRDTVSKEPKLIIDLAKLKRAVDARHRCGYTSWMFWICLFHPTDYSSPPAGFGPMGTSSYPARTMLTICDGKMVVNRRSLRGLIMSMPSEQRPAVLRHFTRVLWSTAHYLLLQPDATCFGWTNVPFEFTQKDILNLNLFNPLPRSDPGDFIIQ